LYDRLRGKLFRLEEEGIDPRPIELTHALAWKYSFEDFGEELGEQNLEFVARFGEELRADFLDPFHFRA
jgi:hypothetical protein